MLWPKDVLAYPTEMDETTIERVLVTCESVANLPVPDPKRFSSCLKLLRATVLLLTNYLLLTMCIRKCRKLNAEVDCNTLEKANRLLLQHAQGDTFAEEISTIKN